MKKIVIGIVLSLSVALLSFIAVSCGEEYKALPAPQNFRQNSINRDRNILWDEVPNAWGYVVKFYGEEYDTEQAKFKLPEGIKPGMYEIEVYAYGDIRQKNDSATVKYKFRIAEKRVAADNGAIFDLLYDGESYSLLYDTKAQYVVGTLDFPSTINDLPVKVISSLVKFKGNSVIPNEVTTKVIIPPTVERIDGFYSYVAIEEIEIPDSVKFIAPRAFGHCENLKEVKISEHSQLEVVSEYAFSGCSSLSKITLPKGLKELQKGVFQWCIKLKTINLPLGLKEIPPTCFSNCDIYELEIPDSVEIIGSNAFGATVSDYMSNFKKITIPDSVKEIGGAAFTGCNLEEVVISSQSKLEVIGSCAFYKCKSLSKITLPKGLKRIGSGAFEQCTSLTKITLPNSLETLAWAAFRNSPICEIVIPHSLKNLEKQPFPECIQKIFYEGTQAEWEALAAQSNGDLEKPFYDAKIYYYSDAPADNSWRYVDGNPTPWNEE